MAEDKRFNDGCDKINEVITEYDQTRSDLQTAVDLILGLLVTFGLAEKRRIPPQHAGVHRCNRGGTGLIASAVQALLTFILGNGWSWRATAKACAVEVLPGEVHDDAIEFQNSVANASAGMIAKPTHDLQVVTLECCHTTAVLNAIRCACKHDGSAIADDQGRLSLARLEERSSEFARAVREGLEYLVIRHKVTVRCPRMCGMISRAGNLEHEANQEESPWQVLFHIHSAAQLAGANVDWTKIVAEIALQRPSMRADLPGMASFVEKCSGGTDAPLLKSVDSY